MKIKCPMCWLHFENRDNLSNHLRGHTLELPYEYSGLLFKIYEKIEFYEFMFNRDDDISYSPNHIRKTLKSLLENK